MPHAQDQWVLTLSVPTLMFSIFVLRTVMEVIFNPNDLAMEGYSV